LNNKNPKISVIIPNYNNEQYLSQCIKSVLNQTYKNLEIIIIDDFSTDESVKIIEKYKNKDKRIKLIKNHKNLNVSRTKNIGIKNSSSEWITTLDSDDYYYSKYKIEKEVKQLKLNNFNIKDVAYSITIHVNEFNDKITKLDYPKKRTNLYEDILSRNINIPRDFIFSKKMFFQINGFNEEINLYEDWDFKIKLSKEVRFLFSGSYGTAYRIHTNGLSSVPYKNRYKKLEDIFQKYYCSKKDSTLKKLFYANINKRALTTLEKENIIKTMISRIEQLGIDSLSIWGTDDLSYKFVTFLDTNRKNIKINYIIDSKAKDETFFFLKKKVYSIEKVIDLGEKNFIILSWNNRFLLRDILLTQLSPSTNYNLVYPLNSDFKDK
jgi:glycosyltransferase involved in cell wall biosynthesis